MKTIYEEIREVRERAEKAREIYIASRRETQRLKDIFTTAAKELRRLESLIS